MLTDAAKAFLAKPKIARLGTLTEDGYPHVVPLWFDVDGDDLVIISDYRTRKMKNLLANPKGSVQVGGEPGADSEGWLFLGDFELTRDEGHTWTTRITYRYETPEEAEKNLAQWRNDDIWLLRLKVKKSIKVW
jgi:predicted pyridoxine 5'-phosphate oxidase superfamily flavin-nucleotide-binding protein